ncbi:MAG: hypothetical protein ACLR6B_08405 [Blautia sp.]
MSIWQMNTSTQKERFGHWKDTAIMIEGEAVRSFTIMFLEMWSVDKNLKNTPMELFEKYLDIIPDKESEPGDGFCHALRGQSSG